MIQATNFEKAGDFMEAFGVQELRDGMGKASLLEIADALTDILYVVYGAGHTFGIDLDECYNEVHRSNMTKLGEDGRPMYRPDGKVMKGPNYEEPNLIPFVN